MGDAAPPYPQQHHGEERYEKPVGVVTFVPFVSVTTYCWAQPLKAIRLTKRSQPGLFMPDRPYHSPLIFQDRISLHTPPPSHVSAIFTVSGHRWLKRMKLSVKISA